MDHLSVVDIGQRIAVGADCLDRKAQFVQVQKRTDEKSDGVAFDLKIGRFLMGIDFLVMVSDLMFEPGDLFYQIEIIVEKAAACSIYSNVDAELITADFTKLGPEVMLSGVALSLAEHLLGQEDDSE